MERYLKGITKIEYIHPFTFLSQWRSLPKYELISYVLMFASMPMLAYGIKPYNISIFVTIIFTILALYSGFFATLIWNDITDADIDAIVHSDRPIPAGRMGKKRFFAIALLFSALTFVFSYLVSFWCLIVVGAAALFVAFHNKYFRRIIRFSAYSEVFTPLQWVIVPIFGFLAVNSSNYQNMFLLVVFTYFTDKAHDIPEGIHDKKGDQKYGVSTYTTSFGEKNAVKISFVMLFISGILGLIIFFATILTFFFLIPFLVVWLYTLYHMVKLLKAKKSELQKLGGIVGRKSFDFFILAYDFIFLDLLIQIFVLINSY